MKKGWSSKVGRGRGKKWWRDQHYHHSQTTGLRWLYSTDDVSAEIAEMVSESKHEDDTEKVGGLIGWMVNIVVGCVKHHYTPTPTTSTSPATTTPSTTTTSSNTHSPPPSPVHVSEAAARQESSKPPHRGCVSAISTTTLRHQRCGWKRRVPSGWWSCFGWNGVGDIIGRKV